MTKSAEEIRVSKPWPEWMIRFMGSDAPDALEDLIWSVGGSPPYGGISYDEAAAVYELLEDYSGPGRAAESSYDKVRAFLTESPERSRVLDLFHCYDEITSNSEDYRSEVVERGKKLAKQIGHPALQALFVLFDSQLKMQQGETQAAIDMLLDCIRKFLDAADEDPIYARRVADAGNNAIALTAMQGDLDGATELLDQLVDVLRPESVTQLRAYINAQRN